MNFDCYFLCDMLISFPNPLFKQLLGHVCRIMCNHLPTSCLWKWSLLYFKVNVKLL